MTLTNFESGIEAVVIGASGGIGRALALALAEDPAVTRVVAFARSGNSPTHDKIRNEFMDLTDEASVAAGAAVTRKQDLRVVLVATGLLHNGEVIQPEKTWSQITPAAMASAFAINATGPALVGKHFLPLLPRHGRAIFAALSARVGSIGDNRLGGWIAYRASKAALNMVLQTLAIELRRRRPDAIIAGLHPGTVDTALSAPFQANVPDGQLLTPQHSAQCLLQVIDRLRAGDSGRVFAYDGSPIPH